MSAHKIEISCFGAITPAQIRAKIWSAESRECPNIEYGTDVITVNYDNQDELNNIIYMLFRVIATTL